MVPRRPSWPCEVWSMGSAVAGGTQGDAGGAKGDMEASGRWKGGLRGVGGAGRCVRRVSRSV